MRGGEVSPRAHALMIGDAPGDRERPAANERPVLPINPMRGGGHWRAVLRRGIDRFLAGRFAGDYQAELLAEFDRYLPDRPPWPVAE